VLDNSDEVRHDLMILGLDPLFALNVLGPNVASARFVAPDEDITLRFHCHVATHEKMGMAGTDRRPWRRQGRAGGRAGAGRRQMFHGTGTVIAALPR